MSKGEKKRRRALEAYWALQRAASMAAERVDDLHRINGITTYCTHQTSGRIHEYAGIRKAIPVTTPNHQIHVFIENRFDFGLSDDGAPW